MEQAVKTVRFND